MISIDQDSITSNSRSNERQKVDVNSGLTDPRYTLYDNDRIELTDENALDDQTLERSLSDMIRREIVNVVDTVEIKIQNAFLAAVFNIITPRIELAVMPMNASSGRDFAIVFANLERGEQLGIISSTENASDWNNIFHELNLTDETQECNS